MKKKKALTWDELAEAYNAAHPNSRVAKTLPLDHIFKWAEKQTDKFMVLSDGFIYKVEKKSYKYHVWFTLNGVRQYTWYMAKDEKEARSLLRSDYPDCMNINQVRRDE